MEFKIKIFIPNDSLYKELKIEAENILQAKNLGDKIFKEEFSKSGKRSGNYIIEQA